MAATVSTDGRIQRRSGYAEQARSVGKKELETDQHFLLHWKAYNFTKRVGMKHQPFIEDNDSERTESMDLGTYVVQNQNCLAPGRLLWAKMDPSPWWPVQIVDERTVSQNCIFNDPIKGGVLARFYGSCIYAWVDPFAYVSHFQESFKEKGSNLRAFQKALEEEMLLRSKIVKSCVEPNGKSQYPETSSQHNKSGSATGCYNRWF